MEITINGTVLPFVFTMGAIIDFKRLTGKDVDKLPEDDVEGMVALCYCCIKTACRKEGKIFDISFQDFADSLSFQEFIAMSNGLVSQQANDADKKKGEEAPPAEKPAGRA